MGIKSSRVRLKVISDLCSNKSVCEADTQEGGLGHGGCGEVQPKFTVPQPLKIKAVVSCPLILHATCFS